MKIFDKLEIYKKLFNKKMRNMSKKKKNQNNTNKNNSAICLSARDKKNFHSHSLENDYNSARQKNSKHKLKTMRNFSLSSLNGRKNNKTKNFHTKKKTKAY